MPAVAVLETGSRRETRSIPYLVRAALQTTYVDGDRPRLVKVTDTGQVVYKAEKQACQAFPDPYADDLKAGTNRNFQVLSPLDFLSEFTQHIPPKGSHLIRPRSLLKRWLVLEQVAWYAQEGGS